MTLEDAKQAKRDHQIVRLKSDHNRWGYITVLDDEETGCYLMMVGYGLAHPFFMLRDLEIDLG